MPTRQKKMLTAFEKFFLYQRSIVETVIDQLKSICHIEHSRHPSPVNFLVNLVGGLAAYALKPRKPEIKINKRRAQQAQFVYNGRTMPYVCRCNLLGNDSQNNLWNIDSFSS